MSVKKTSFFTMCHYSEFHKITYVNFRRNDLQDDVKFSLGKCFLATQKLLRRHKITPYVDCVTKELGRNPAFEITQNRTGERFQKQITNLYAVLLNYFVFYHLKFVSAEIFCHCSVYYDYAPY